MYQDKKRATLRKLVRNLIWSTKIEKKNIKATQEPDWKMGVSWKILKIPQWYFLSKKFLMKGVQKKIGPGVLLFHNK